MGINKEDVAGKVTDCEQLCLDCPLPGLQLLEDLP